MRSGAGAACPFTRRDLFLDELFPDLLDFLAVAPVVLEWTTLRLLVALLWLMFDAVFCAATAGKLAPPAAIAARIQPASVCLQSKVRMSGYASSVVAYLPSAGTTPGRNTVTVRSL